VELLSDAVAVRFNRLIRSVLDGDLKGNSFQPWELEIILDLERWPLPQAEFRRAILRYQRYGNRCLCKGAAVPQTISDYFQHVRSWATARLH
jgi:hypothetical protein